MRPGGALGRVVLAVGLLAACAAPERPSAPPGVLVLLVDCLRADALAAYASRLGATPHLDSLAADGVVFERAFSVASWTRPAVPSLLTGLYPSEHGLVGLIASGGGARVEVLADEVWTLAEAMRAAGYETALVANQFQLSSSFGLTQGFAHYRNNLHSATSIHREFLRWLDGIGQRPFFAYLHYLDIHWPYQPRRATRGRFGSTRIDSEFDRDPQGMRRAVREGRSPLSENARRELEARYAEALAGLDRDVGNLLRELDRRGALAETLIVLTSDHGEEFGEHGGIEHGHSLYNELLRVPFVWRLPASWRGRAPRRVPALVETRALAPTLMELVGQPAPGGVTAPSLMPWLHGPRPSSPPFAAVVAESNGLYSVQTERWKLVLTPAANRVELYDLLADPGETRNLAAQGHPEEEAMRDRLRRWRALLRPVTPATIDLEAETVEGLRALGYLQ